MIFPLLTFLAWCALALWMNGGLHRPGPEVDKVMLALLALMFVIASVIAIGIGCGIAGFVGGEAKQVMDGEASYSRHLVALKSSVGVSGSFTSSFFLGQGSIGSAMFYFYYEQFGENSYRPMQQAISGGVVVYEEERTDAVIEKYAWHFKHKWMDWFGFEPGGTTVYFRVPKGSILRGYTL